MRGTLSFAAACALIAIGIAGCAETPLETASQVAPGIPFRDASKLSVTIADILAASLAPTRSTLLVAPVGDTDPMHIGQLLNDSLRERGFAVWTDGTSYAMAHAVRYRIAPVDGYVQLALYVDQASATCLYTHDADQVLVSVGSCSVRPSQALTLRIPDDARLTHQMLAQAKGPLPLTPESVGQVWTNKASVGASSVAGSPAPYAAPVSAVPPGAAATQLTTLPAAAPPVVAASAPVIPVQNWTLVGGQPIRDQMQAWADRAGWTIVWPERLNWLVPATASFTGDYTTVLSEIVTDIVKDGRSVRVHFYDPNHTAVVTTPGGEQLPQ